MSPSLKRFWGSDTDSLTPQLSLELTRAFSLARSSVAMLFFPTQNVTFEGKGKSGALSWYFSSSDTHSVQKG